MGEKIAPAWASAELPRMETPREALAQGVSPAPIHAASTPTPATSPANGHAAVIAPTEVAPTVEKAYSEQIIENAPEAISIIDLDLKIVRINAEFTNLFGFAVGTGGKKQLARLIVPPDRYAKTAWIPQTIKSKNKLRLETRR